MRIVRRYGIGRIGSAMILVGVFLYFLSGWISAFVIVAGLMLVLRRLILARQEEAAEEKAFATPPTGSYSPEILSRRVRDKWQPLRPPSQWALYSHWAIHIVSFLMLILIAEMVFNSFRLPVRGIWVRGLLGKMTSMATKEPPTPKLVLRVVCNSRGRRYEVHDRPLSDLQEELKHELARQRDWTVYVDGDSDCEFTDVMDAIDAVRGLQAKVVLVTPASRALIESDPQTPMLGQRLVIPTVSRQSNDK